MEVSILNIVRILHVTTTGTEYEAHIYRTIATYVLHTLSSNLDRTHLTTADHNSTGTSSIRTSSWFTKTISAMRRVVEAIRFCSDSLISSKRTNGTLQTSAIYTVIDVTVSHGDTCILQYISFTTTTIDATITDRNLFCALSYSGIGIRISTDIHEGVASYVSIFTTTKHITRNMDTESCLIIVLDRCCDILTVFNI